MFTCNGDVQLPMKPEDLDMVLLGAWWFREHPVELEVVLSPGEARGLSGCETLRIRANGGQDWP